MKREGKKNFVDVVEHTICVQTFKCVRVGKKRPPRRLHKKDLFVYVCVYRMVCKKYPVGNNITPEMPPPKKEKIAASFNCPKPIPPKRVSIDRHGFQKQKRCLSAFQLLFFRMSRATFLFVVWLSAIHNTDTVYAKSDSKSGRLLSFFCLAFLFMYNIKIHITF